MNIDEETVEDSTKQADASQDQGQGQKQNLVHANETASDDGSSLIVE